MFSSEGLSTASPVLIFGAGSACTSMLRDMIVTFKLFIPMAHHDEPID